MKMHNIFGNCKKKYDIFKKTLDGNRFFSYKGSFREFVKDISKKEGYEKNSTI